MVAFPVEITNPQPETWSAPTVATLIIAGFALLVSLGSAAFNIWSWKAQGSNGRLEISPRINRDAYDGDKSILVSFKNVGRMPLPVLMVGLGRKKRVFSREVPFKMLEGSGRFPSADDLKKGVQPKVEPFEWMWGPIRVAEIVEYCQEKNFPLCQVRIVVGTPMKIYKARIPRAIRRKIQCFQEAQENQTPDSDS